MKISKILWYDITCPHCGAKVRLSNDEYDKYIKDCDGYGGGRILCTESDPDGKPYEIYYYNFDCPVCDNYIPITVHPDSSDTYGFKLGKTVKPFYDIEQDLTLEAYMNKKFFGEEEIDGEELIR